MVSQTLHEVLKSNFSVWTTSEKFKDSVEKLHIIHNLSIVHGRKGFRELYGKVEQVVCARSKLFVAMEQPETLTLSLNVGTEITVFPKM